MASPFPLSYTTTLCTINRSRAVELPIDPRRSHSPFSTPSASSTNTPPPAPPSTRLPSPTGSDHTPATPSSSMHTNTIGTGSNRNRNSTGTINGAANDRSPLGIPVREVSHTTHRGYVADVAARPALELSAMTATFNRRALALVRRTLVFHTDLLKKGDDESKKAKKGKRNDGAALMREKAAGFVDGAGDVVDAQGGGRVVISPAQLLRLKAVVNYLSVDRVIDTLTWIDDHEIARVATRLETADLSRNQQWCGSCMRMFFLTAAGDVFVPPGTMTKNAMGVHECRHILCKDCVVNWFYDVMVRGTTGTQPCCVRLLGLEE